MSKKKKKKQQQPQNKNKTKTKQKQKQRKTKAKNKNENETPQHISLTIIIEACSLQTYALDYRMLNQNVKNCSSINLSTHNWNETERNMACQVKTEKKYSNNLFLK